MNNANRSAAIPATSLAWLALLFAGSATAAEPLTLRVNDTVARPGSIAAVTLRTYASRPIGQGQICMVFAQRSAGTVPGGPIDAVEGAEVFSIHDDTTHDLWFDADDPAQATMVDFVSPGAGVNAHDGPLAVIFFRIRADALPGDEYELSVDPPNTFLVGANGKPIDLEPRAGRLRIRAPGEPVTLTGSAEVTIAGDLATFGLSTDEQFFLGSGQVAIRYALPDAGWRKVSMDPRHGAATFTTLLWPGTVFVEFDSPDASLNRVPGNLVTVTIPTPAGLTRPLQMPVTLDPGLTLIRDATGAPIAVDLEAEILTVVPAPLYDPVKPRPTVPFLRR